MNSNQKAGLAVLGGTATFLGAFGSFLMGHDQWKEVITPEAMGHICLIISSAIIAIIGGLKYQKPRTSGMYRDRVSDRKLWEVNGGKNNE